MAESIGITDLTTDFDNKRNAVNQKFAKELSFVSGLPTAIETEKHIFVHAGIENRTDWENSSEDVYKRQRLSSVPKPCDATDATY